MSLDRKRTWAVAGAAAAAGAGVAARWALRRGWRVAFEEEPPDNPAAPEVTWRTALLWAALSGVLVESARVIGKRLAAGAFSAADEPPPMTAGEPT